MGIIDLTASLPPPHLLRRLPIAASRRASNHSAPLLKPQYIPQSTASRDDLTGIINERNSATFSFSEGISISNKTKW